jgi:hypothetical protein
LLDAGLDYEIVVLEETTQQDLINAERWWIAFGRACGWPRAKISAAMRARMSTPEARLFGDANPARREDVRAKMRESARRRHEREAQERAEAQSKLTEAGDA